MKSSARLLKHSSFFSRDGMKEILESIRTQDGNSDVRIQSESLDQIITALDARHLWGNYHPAMQLKSQIEKLEGANSGMNVHDEMSLFFLFARDKETVQVD